MAVPSEPLKKGWELIRTKGIPDDPRPLAKYLGCGHTMKVLDRNTCAEKMGWVNGVTRSLRGAGMLADSTNVGVKSKSGAEMPPIASTATAERRAMQYQMHGFTRQ